jgi:hypothetical protein
MFSIYYKFSPNYLQYLIQCKWVVVVTLSCLGSNNREEVCTWHILYRCNFSPKIFSVHGWLNLGIWWNEVDTEDQLYFLCSFSPLYVLMLKIINLQWWVIFNVRSLIIFLFLTNKYSYFVSYLILLAFEALLFSTFHFTNLLAL